MKEWQKVPSVMTGGKAFFYVRYDETHYPYRIRQEICWHRGAQAYAVRSNEVLIALVGTVKEGKQLLNNMMQRKEA